MILYVKVFFNVTYCLSTVDIQNDEIYFLVSVFF